MIRAVPLAVLLIGGLTLFGPFTTEPDIPRWASIFALAGVSFIFVSSQTFSRSLPVGKMDLAALVLLAWAALSFAWTTDWRGALYAIAKCSALFMVYYGVRTAPEKVVHSAVRWGVSVSVLIVLALLAFNPLLDGVRVRYGELALLIDGNLYGGFWLQNFVTEFLMIAAPLVLLSMSEGQKWRVFSALLVIAAYVSTLFIKGMLEWPVFALFGTILVTKALNISLKKTGIIVATAGIAVSVGTFFIFPEVAASFDVRSELWINTLYLISQSPVWGYGLSSFSGQYDGVMAFHSTLFPEMGQQVYRAGAFAGMAHNEFLQLWAELGAVGMVLAFLFIREAFKCRVAVTPKGIWMASGAILSLLATVVLSLLEFPLQNPATALCAVISLGILARNQRELVFVRSKWFSVPMVPAALLGTFAWAWVAFWSWDASYHMSLFKAWWHQDKLQAAKHNFEAYAAFPLDSFIRRQLPGSVNALVNAAPGRVIIDPKTADALYWVGKSAAPYSVEVRLARLQYMFQSGRWQEPETGILVDDLKKRDPFRPEVWVADSFYSAFTGQESRMRSAAEKAMQLSPGIEKKLEPFGRLVAAIKESKP